jgi:DNA-binding MarR family transcriptional regulator
MEERISLLLMQVAKAHRARMGEGLAGLGLHLGQETVLMQLWEEEGLTQSQLVERLGVEPPTVTKMLQRMERAGFVTRREDVRDARVSRVHLTPRGRKLEASVRAVARRAEEQLVKRLSPEERSELRRLLRTLRDAPG